MNIRRLIAGAAIASAVAAGSLTAAANDSYLGSLSGDSKEVELSWGTLNVRSGAGLGYKVIDSLTDGEIVVELVSGGGWTRIRYDGAKTGYVSSAYLKTPSAAQTPAAPAARSLSVPYYSQNDSRWSSVKIASSTIGKIGCTTTSLAMCESYRTGSTITPDAMRWRLSYTSGGALYWPSNYTFYYGSAYISQIKTLIDSGKPVIIGAKKSSGSQHWVVVKGYSNGGTKASDFAIKDPGTGRRSTLAQFLADYPVFLKLAWYK